MKKINIIFLSIVMLLSILLCSCQPSNSDISNNGSDNNDTSSNGDEATISNEFKTVIYGETEDSTIFHASKSEYEKFDVHEYKENISKNQITVDILGTKYTGVYTNSAKLPQSNLNVHVYELQGTELGSIFVDPKTNSILEYSCVPNPQIEKLRTENDYIEFIKSLLGSRFNPEKYDYKCKTHYRQYREEDGDRGRTEDGFKIFGENEVYRSLEYNFYYTMSKNGIDLPNHVSACFYDDKFILEMYEFDYGIEDYSPILNRMDEVEKSIEDHLRENVKDGCTLVNIEHGNKHVFIQDGVPYVMVTSTVTYTSIYYHGETFSTLIQTITG